MKSGTPLGAWDAPHVLGTPLGAGPALTLPVRRMHLALKAYQELLRTVQEMDRSPEQAVRDSSQVIKSESVCPATPRRGPTPAPLN